MSLVFNPGSSFGIECPQCSNQLIAPESSEYWSEVEHPSRLALPKMRLPFQDNWQQQVGCNDRKRHTPSPSTIDLHSQSSRVDTVRYERPNRLLLAIRAFAALRQFAMRLRAYLNGQLIDAIGIVFIRPFQSVRRALCVGSASSNS